MVLVSPTADEYELLRKQLLERMETGNGEIIYDIGQGEGMALILHIIINKIQPR